MQKTEYKKTELLGIIKTGMKELEDNCSDITRTCFICHDPDIWVNPRKDEIEPNHFVYDPSILMPEKRHIPVLQTMVRYVLQSLYIHLKKYKKILGGRDYGRTNNL